MRSILLVLVFISTILPAQRDTLVSGIKFHLISDSDTGTSWIQFKVNKKGVTRFRGWYLEYYHDGKVKAKGHYKNGKLSDDWTRYYPGGQVAEKGYYDNGYKSDLWQTFYENGKMSWKGSFFKGIRSGFWRYYYENGQLKGMTRYRIKTEKAQRKKTDKTKGVSFKVNVEITYLVSPADSLVEYYPDGKLRTRIIYGKEGGRNGTVDYYYENGQKNMHGEYANGIQTGEWTWYCSDGSVSSREKYAVDKKEPVEVKAENPCGHLLMQPWMKWEVERITL